MKFISALTLILLSTRLIASPYVELCIGDKYLSKDFGEGNIAGHALIYVEGLCKDMGVDYAQAKICDEADNHTGIGVSLDSGMKNVMWLAVPTKELALFGDYGSGKVDKEVVQKIFDKAREYRVFENVKIDESVFPKNIVEYTSDKLDQYALYSIGTSIAFNTGRNVRCLKVNIGSKQLENIATYLNGQNEKYYHGDKDYVWSLSDNCTHLSVNALAQAGIGRGRKASTKRSFIGNLFSLTLPKSELLKMVRRVNKRTYSPKIIWEREKYREFFQEYNRLPWGVGNLVTKYGIVKDNELFQTTGGSQFSHPIIGMSLKKIERDRYTDEKANLKYHRKGIKRALKSFYFKKSFADKEMMDFLGNYKAFLVSELESIEASLNSK